MKRCKERIQRIIEDALIDESFKNGRIHIYALRRLNKDLGINIDWAEKEEIL